MKLRGSSNPALDEVTINFVNKYFDVRSKILDIGPGRGKYGKYFKRYHENIDAIEIYKPYIEAFDLKNIYRKVFEGNALDFDYKKNPYDLVIMGDVLEHFTTEDAQKLLKKIEDSGSSVVVKVPYLWKDDKPQDNIYENHLQEDLTREVMFQRYPSLKYLKDVNKFGIYYRLTDKAEIKSLGVILGHVKYFEAVKHLKWVKRFIKKVAYVRNTFGLSVIEDAPEFLNIEAPNPKVIPDRIMGNFYNIFRKRYDPYYYFIFEWDALPIDPDFEEKCINHMERNKIDALFPNLLSNTTAPTHHPFTQRYPSMLAKKWATTNCIVINKIALDFYTNVSFNAYPEFWCEIRFPTVLSHEGFFVAQNPFIYRDGCRAGEELDEFTIRRSVDWGSGVIHPIKDYDKQFPLVESILIEKGKIKKEEKKDA